MAIKLFYQCKECLSVAETERSIEHNSDCSQKEILQHRIGVEKLSKYLANLLPVESMRVPGWPGTQSIADDILTFLNENNLGK